MKSFKDYYVSEAKNTELNTFDEVLKYGWNYAKKLWEKSGFYEPRPSFGSFSFSKPTEITTIEKLGYPNIYVKLFLLSGEMRAEIIGHGYNDLLKMYAYKFYYPLSVKDLERGIQDIIDSLDSFYKSGKGQKYFVKRYQRIYKEIEKSLRTTKEIGSFIDISNGDISDTNDEPSIIQFDVKGYAGTFVINYIVDGDNIKEYKIIYVNHEMKGKTDLLITDGKSIKLDKFLILLNSKLSDIINKFYLKEIAGKRIPTKTYIFKD